MMFVNNEIGVIQPIAELGKVCRENKVFFHTDAAQALGKVPIDGAIRYVPTRGRVRWGPLGCYAALARS